MVGRVLDLGHECRPGDGVSAAIADDDGDVLFAVDCVGDRTGTRNVVEAHFPEHFSI